YYKNLYNSQNQATDEAGQPIEVKIKKNRVYQNLKADPSGNYLAYSSNKQGQVRIFLYDLANNKRQKLFKKGHQLERITDYSYPVLDWHPSGEALSFVMEEKGEVLLYTYYLETEEQIIQPLFGMEKVLAFDYADDGFQIVFSAVY